MATKILSASSKSTYVLIFQNFAYWTHVCYLLIITIIDNQT